MAIAPHIKELMNSKDASVIRKMFEEGALLKKEFGEDKVYDFSIGNPDLEPPEAVVQEIVSVAQNQQKGCHGYMPNAGYISVITGGIVSLGPPLGGVVVFAHECENIIAPNTSAIGINGKNLDRNLFIFNNL